jgi:hypothetical protein
LDGIWSNAPMAENVQSPGGQSDHNSTSYGSLQQTSLLHEGFSDHCQFGTDVSGFEDFVTPSLSPSSGHHQLMTSTSFNEPPHESCFAPFGSIGSSQGHASDSRYRHTSPVTGFSEGYSRGPWHMTNAFSEMTVGGERNAEPYTARNVNPIGTRERVSDKQTAFGSQWPQTRSDPRQGKMMHLPLSTHSSDMPWSDHPSQSQFLMPPVGSNFMPNAEMNVSQSSHSIDISRRHVVENTVGEKAYSRNTFGSPDQMRANARARMGDAARQEELARIPPHMRQQYVEAIVAAHLTSNAALLGPGSSRFMQAAMWPHPAVYRCVVDPFAGSHLVNRKVPVIVGGPTQGPMTYDLPVTAPFAIPVPAFKSFR